MDRLLDEMLTGILEQYQRDFKQLLKVEAMVLISCCTSVFAAVFSVILVVLLLYL